jgi:peptidoglycan/xylan/chitin deacetylase (PgdA/CDA1 family)
LHTPEANRTVVNLTVHGIGPVERELEPGEDLVWVSIEQFERVLDAVVGRDDVRVMFDDGNASDVDIALPRLVKRGLKAEFFILAGRLGEEGRVDRNGVRDLLRAGMTVGSHGWAHRDWRKISPAEADEEISMANEVIADLTGKPVSRVAIPYGSYDRHVLYRLRRARLDTVYTSDGGRRRANSWLQPRNSLRHDLDDAWISQVLDADPPLPRRARLAAARTAKRLRG